MTDRMFATIIHEAANVAASSKLTTAEIMEDPPDPPTSKAIAALLEMHKADADTGRSLREQIRYAAWIIACGENEDRWDEAYRIGDEAYERLRAEFIQ